VSITTTFLGKRLQTFKKGNLKADGSEQTIFEFEGIGSVSGYIDLSEMKAGDTVVIKQYMRVNGDYTLYASDTYADLQAMPLLYFPPKNVDEALKITLQQTSGLYRPFHNNFMVE